MQTNFTNTHTRAHTHADCKHYCLRSFLERHFECLRVAFDGGTGDFQRAALHIRPPSQLTASALIIHLVGGIVLFLPGCFFTAVSQDKVKWHKTGIIWKVCNWQFETRYNILEKYYIRTSLRHHTIHFGLSCVNERQVGLSTQSRHLGADTATNHPV